MWIVSFLIKILFPTIFVNKEKLKKSNLEAKIIAPKSGNFCRFWPVLGPAIQQKFAESK